MTAQNNYLQQQFKTTVVNTVSKPFSSAMRSSLRDKIRSLQPLCGDNRGNHIIQLLFSIPSLIAAVLLATFVVQTGVQ